MLFTKNVFIGIFIQLERKKHLITNIADLETKKSGLEKQYKKSLSKTRC